MYVTQPNTEQNHTQGFFLFFGIVFVDMLKAH